MVAIGIQLKKENYINGRSFRDDFANTLYYLNVDIIAKKQVLLA